MNDAMTFASNYCKISPATQLRINQYFNQIKKKWSMTQGQVCYGLNIENPTFNLNMLFEDMVQGSTGNGVVTNSKRAKIGGGFWDYYKRGLGISMSLIKGPGHFVYDLG